VAFDGDADRALFVAEDGSVVDGDAILLMAAEYLAAHDRLTNNLVVTTVMANMGLEKALQERGLCMVRTPVGDKYVLEEMVRRGAALGGEQSGHIIFREYATTGDGLLTARMILRVLSETKKSLSALKNGLTVFPQRLENIRIKHKTPFEQVPALRDAVAQSEQELIGRGRVVVRYSGTEPLVRIMVEAEDMPLVDKHVGRLAGLFQAQLGA
jgi:phosphoglucosamine mutase